MIEAAEFQGTTLGSQQSPNTWNVGLGRCMLLFLLLYALGLEESPSLQ